jgi:beta-glucosidase
VVDFGADDEAFLDVCFGVGDAMPQGRLPFDLPRSMEAASRAREDVPFDTEDALFKFGFGLRYQD